MYKLRAYKLREISCPSTQELLAMSASWVCHLRSVVKYYTMNSVHDLLLKGSLGQNKQWGNYAMETPTISDKRKVISCQTKYSTCTSSIYSR